MFKLGPLTEVQQLLAIVILNYYLIGRINLE